MRFNATPHLEHCRNIDELRKLAKKKIPLAFFDYIDSAAEDGVTRDKNRQAFDDYSLVPRILVDVDSVSLKSKLFNQELESPVILAPTALSRLFHHQGEVAVSQAASKAGLIYTLSTMSSVSLEEVANAEGPRWFQIYCYKDRDITRDMIHRAKNSGYSALCLTVDAHVAGNREHDQRNGLTIPPTPNLATIINSLKHPAWLWHMATSPTVTMANIRGNENAGIRQSLSVIQYVTEQLNPALSWEDIKWMRDEWDGPFIIKGVLNASDARKSVDFGADGIVISNHGGRQLDQTPSTIEVLPEIVSAVGEQCEIIIDSGFRRGTDIIKALSLGAKACMVGRPYVYGLAAGGQPGVEKALTILQSEVRRNLQLLGCRSIRDLNRAFIRRRLQ